MIENPIPMSFDLLQRGNAFELLKRIKYSYRKHVNSNNSFTVTPEQFKNYYKFSFVRNPWARTYSWYKNVIRDQVQQSNLGVTAEISLADFVKKFVGKGMLKRQTYWLENFQGNLDIDFIGRFENLGDDFRTVANSLGKPELRLPHEIKGSNHDYRTAYATQTIELVAQFYSNEIQQFGYEFD